MDIRSGIPCGIVLYPAVYYKEKGSDLSKYKVTKRGCKFNLQPLLRLFAVDSGAVVDNQRAEQLFGQVELSVLIAKQPALARQLLDSRVLSMIFFTSASVMSGSSFFCNPCLNAVHADALSTNGAGQFLCVTS